MVCLIFSIFLFGSITKIFILEKGFKIDVFEDEFNKMHVCKEIKEADGKK